MQMTVVKEESYGFPDHCGIEFDLLVHENIIDTKENRILIFLISSLLKCHNYCVTLLGRHKIKRLLSLSTDSNFS